MGLLDSINDPQTMGLLALGSGLLNSRGSFGSALGQAVPQALQAVRQVGEDRQKAEQLKQQRAMQALQMQQAQMALAEAQRAQADRERQQQFLQNLPSPQMGAVSQTLAGGGGPSVANAARVPAVDPTQQLMFNAVKQGIMPLPTYLASLQKDETPIALGEGGKLVTRGGRELAANPKAPDLNSLVVMGPDGKPMLNKLAFDAKRQLAEAGRSSTTVSYGAPVAGVDAKGNPVFFQPDKGGGAPAIVPGVAPPKNDKPMTEAQAKAATFKSQMEAAEKELGTMPLDMSKVWNQADVGLASGMTNALASPIAQRARQAQDQWSESFLRFKTGAAATTDEVRLNNRTFFPQPGDSKEVIQQKKRMRDQAIQDIGMAASGNPPDHSAGKPAAAADPLGLRGGK